MAKIIDCPHLAGFGMSSYCLDGRWPMNCTTCDCKDKRLVEITSTNTLDDGKVPSFEELATKTEPFEPPYDKEEFKQYIQKSIDDSRKADAEANRTAAKIRLT